MQRVMIVISVLLLVGVGSALGSLAAHWPFWQRALSWQQAGGSWPGHLQGPWRELKPAKTVSVLQFNSDDSLPSVFPGSDILLVADAAGSVRSYFSDPEGAHKPVDGRGLVQGLLAPLYGALVADGRDTLLDEPVGPFLSGWEADPRGLMTARHLLWQLSGLPGGPYRPLNPFSERAQLASGPSFDRAVMSIQLTYPPGSHFEASPANAQVLALLASQISDDSFANVLEAKLWSRFAAGTARGLLDHRRGTLAAHCCFSALPEDWLRLALLLANDGMVNGERLLPMGFVKVMATASPVNPGYGLGYQIEAGEGGQTLLIMQSSGRLLAADLGSGRGLFWSGPAGPNAVLRKKLLRELSTGVDKAIEK
jgi:CubicO group peptidase (beta-lactamase class C family)